MNKKFLITGIACTLVAFVLSMVIHGLFMFEDYSKLPNLLRPQSEAQTLFHFMALAHVSMGFAFAWIYRQGMTPGVSWVLQGIRFGLAIAFLMTIPIYLIYYTIQPWPGMVVVKQIVFDVAVLIINGLVAAFINRE